MPAPDPSSEYHDACEQCQRLRRLLARRAQQTADGVLRAQGQINADEVERLERLGHLISIFESPPLQPPRRWWPVVVVVSGSLLLISILLFARVPDTEVALHVAVSEFGFELAEQQVVTNLIALRALGASELEEIRSPQVRDRSIQTIRAGASKLAVSVSGLIAESQRGKVSLDALMLPAESQVRLQQMGAANQYRMSIAGAGFELHANVSGPVRLGWAGGSVEVVDFESPRPLVLVPASEGVDVSLELLERNENFFAGQIPVRDLRLFAIEEHVEPEGTIVRRISTVLSGFLYMEGLDGRRIDLRRGERIRFDKTRGEIRSILLDADHISVEFSGQVSGMKVGSEDAARSLMPTYLEWLQADHAVSMFWGAVVFLVGIIGGIVKWLNLRL